MTAEPFPAPADDCTGVTLTIDELAEAMGMSETNARRLLGVAARAVNDYAPRAPSALANEATIRYAGYLVNSLPGGIRRQAIGPKVLEYVTNHAAAFRNSGAAALLTRHKRRRARSIG